MQVWVELALIENFCMDFVLLFCAKLVSKNPAHLARVAFGSAFGACFAVAFPLFNLSGMWAVVVKIISGLIICLISGKFKSFKAYLKLSALFTAFTFVLGGALIAVFSLTGLDYSPASGYILSSVPIGIPLFFGLLLIIFARKLSARLKKTQRQEVNCRIWLNGESVEINGFFDSGNKVKKGGVPVSVIPLATAVKIIDITRIKDEVKIHTVAGSKKLKVFTADKIEIHEGENVNTLNKVLIGISPHTSGVAVLHPDLLEDISCSKK